MHMTTVAVTVLASLIGFAQAAPAGTPTTKIAAATASPTSAPTAGGAVCFDDFDCFLTGGRCEKAGGAFGGLLGTCVPR